MSDFNFDQLVQQHEMGRAYKAITTQMGPSPQLIAFVNYDKVTEDNVGLESFDIMTQHQQILAEIDNNKNLDVALEGFTDTVKKYRGWLIAGGASLILLQVGGPLGLLSIAAGIVGVVKNSGEVPTVKTFTAHTKAFIIINEHLKKSSSLIPGDLDEDKWAKFYDALVADDSEMVGHANVAGTTRSESNEPFDKSGWSESSFKNAVNWLHSETEKFDQLSKSHAAKFESIAKSMATKKDGLGKTPKLVTKSFNFIKAADADAARSLATIEKLLKKVSKSFEVKGKD